MYGAYLIRLLKEQYPTISIMAWGGDQMQQAGADVIQHIRDLSIMGFVEVVKNLARLRRLFKQCQDQILEFQAETVVFIDFPGFNLRLAPWVKRNNMRTIQYISPKVWAWKESRIKTIKKYIDELICIFPFELDYYRQHQINVHYFGNPLQSLIQNYKPNLIKHAAGKEIIALFPGSRKQEISRILPILLRFTERNKKFHFIIGGMSLIGKDVYNSIIDTQYKPDNVSVEFDRNYDILGSSMLAINTSGTITLETALFEKPQIVVYHTHPISYALIKRLIKLRFISLPNILSGQELVPELIQNEFNLKSLQKEFDRAIKTQIDYTNFLGTLKVGDQEGLLNLLINRTK